MAGNELGIVVGIVPSASSFSVGPNWALGIVGGWALGIVVGASWPLGIGALGVLVGG